MRRIDPAFASDEQLTVYHTPEHLARVNEIAQTDGGDTGAGAPIGRGGDRVARSGRRRHDRCGGCRYDRRRQRGVCPGPPTRSPRHGGRGNGILRLQQRRHRGPPGAARSRRGTRSHPRLGRPSWQRDAGRVLGRSQRLVHLIAPGRSLPARVGSGRPGWHRRGRGLHGQYSAAGWYGKSRLRGGVRQDRHADRHGSSIPTW